MKAMAKKTETIPKRKETDHSVPQSMIDDFRRAKKAGEVYDLKFDPVKGGFVIDRDTAPPDIIDWVDNG
jgi:hypothetical protein